MPTASPQPRARTGGLFADPWSKVYAILDGASIERLPKVLWQHAPEHQCLFRGDLEDDMREVAPYLVELRPGTDFTAWAVSGWGEHWGIFMQAPASLSMIELRKHFRTITRVLSPEGKWLYFRFYDPRTLRSYLPTCEPAELDQVFGPVTTFIAEADDAEQAHWFRRRAGGGLDAQTLPAKETLRGSED
jgi:hypothetical protein